MSSHPSISPARRAAFDLLRRIESEQAYSSILLAALPQQNLSREDQALAHELVLGVLRWQKTLDHFIERYANRSPQRLDLAVRLALRLGLYQLRFLARIPPSAAVNESVNLVKRARVTSAAGMVNAVLRKAARRLEDRAGEGVTDAMERAAIETSHPRWLLEHWRRWFGESEVIALAAANNQTPALAFRVNPLYARTDDLLDSLQREGVRVRASTIATDAFVVEEGAAQIVIQAAEQGQIYLQDEASQLVALLLEPQAGERVLDLCAAPGSKASHLAALIKDRGHIVACDLSATRLKTLKQICARLGIHSIDAVALDATRTLPFDANAQGFDRILVDAPCSGTGTVRRNPEIKWRLAPEDLKRFADVQLRLLTNAATMVAVGGRLIYSTCSLEREENEAVAHHFLEAHSQFQIVKPLAADLLTQEGFVRTFPHRHATDGFFAAVLQRHRG